MAPSTAVAVRERIQKELASVQNQLRSQELQEQLEAVLPETVTFEKFTRVAYTALLDDSVRQSDPNKMLLAADRTSLFQAVVKCATDGLLPDGRDAALVKRGDAVVYQPMVGGFRKIAGEHGWDLTGRVVAANDTFTYDDAADPPTIDHVPVKLGQDRGEFVGAYAIARHRDGRRRQLVMDADKIRKRAQQATTKAVWDKWPEEMWEKTPVRALFADLPLDPAERDRVLRVVAASESDLPAREQLYGPRGGFGELPAGETFPVAEPGSSSDAAPDGVAVQSSVEPPPGASPEGGSADDDFGAPAEPEPADTAELEAAQAAASFVVELPNPTNWANGMTLAQIRADERHPLFFNWALHHTAAPPAVRENALAYARVQLPELLEAA